MYFQIGISTQIIFNWKVTTSHFGREVIEIYNLSNCDLSRRVCHVNALQTADSNQAISSNLIGVYH